jgi:hypothetical protein
VRRPGADRRSNNRATRSREVFGTAAIQALQDARGGSFVIAYVTSTRQNLESQMAMDVVEPLYRHLQSLTGDSEDRKIDLFIHSNGGDGIVPWRIVTLIREFCSRFTVLVPNRAFSAATLTALGADEVLMHPMGMLGPTDPTVTNPFNPVDPNNPTQLLGISVEDVASYFALVKEDVGIRHEDELIQAFKTLAEKVHPLALGNVKRSTLQSRMMGDKLLRRRSGGNPLTDHAIEEIVRKLASELYFHGHPINRREAREDVGLDFVTDAADDVAQAMWNLYELYHEDMRLGEAFMPVQEAIALSALPVPAMPGSQMNPTGAPSQATVALGEVKGAYLESTARCDLHRSNFEAVLTRDFQGNYNASVNLLSQGWIVE